MAYPVSEFGEMLVLDDVVRLRAADAVQLPILAYPRLGTTNDFETHTGKQLDGFVDGACKAYLRLGLAAVSPCFLKSRLH